MKSTRYIALLASAFFVPALWADGPKDNIVDNVRPVPPKGIDIPAGVARELQAGVHELGSEIEALRASLKSKPESLDLLPDVQIYHNAVRYALKFHEFFTAREIPIARKLLREGLDRARQLKEGKAPWTTATGLVARGYVSKIDGSVQPYGLVVPATFQAGSGKHHRLDAWFHGRSETLSELNFINGRESNPGEFTPAGAFVLHLYGRYCNANKFSGDIDLLEALDDVKKHYSIDENRIAVRGFSMGGAACWQFAVHYADRWAAAAPGAGFAETPEFLRVFQDEKVKPTWYEQKLWHWYNATDYAANLSNCPVVAYSGEIDRQKQAADIMAKAMKAEGIELVHIIGPKTPHRYHPGAKVEINRRIDAIMEHGRNPVPHKLRFTTWTLRYNRMFWFVADGLEHHWERARADAELHPGGQNQVKIRTENIAALSLQMGPGTCPFIISGRPKVVIDGQEVEPAPIMSDRSWNAHFRKVAGKWATVPSVDDGTLRKRPGLQGPIDDAFLDSFLMVRPTGQPMNAKVGNWTAGEMILAIDHWRRQFRGEARVKSDADVTDADIAAHNLVLWGDPQSNKVLARIAGKLPVKWDSRGVRLGAKTYSADHHVPVLIYPNPLNPKRYIVINSGFTYREYDYLNNARQVPKLPDYAVVDIDVPVTSQKPGGIVDAGFFGERWELVPKAEASAQSSRP